MPQRGATMMKRSMLLVTGAATLLAGCGGSDDFSAKNASVADVASKTKQMQRQEPGEWETTTQITALDNPDIPKGSPTAKLMMEQLGQKQTQKTCVTRPSTARPVFAQAVDPTGQCRYDHISLKQGHIDALLACPAPDGGGTVEMRHRGTFTPKSFDVEATMTRKDSNGGRAGTMTMRITAKRIGDCKA
ncbi:DUF3617 domain-containing protein [Stakelama marina]|uniref:DUF3617 domain-containing protein n=1 Tax=Stakelama marina TaxID=2826939 RepID=A0A8T4IFN1_9SPHN|nr:DUF3617 domain-containing protein [Stakelama marina]MBR0553360.1 DUF3617 domain-containing protein [Stakelama marina]